MSWLRDHFYRFVFPAFVAAEKRTDEIGAPFDVKVSPHAPEKLPTELRKLWSLSAEYGLKWSYDVREVNHHGGTSEFRQSAKIHHSILRSTLDSTLVALREEGCDRVFLGGRDVWSLAVLCEKRGIPYIFVPELSRSVAGTQESKSFLEGAGIKRTDLFLDTGFAGSIPRSLTRLFDFEFKFRLMSQSSAYVPFGGYGARERRMAARKAMPNQLFPNRKRARAEALETEYLAKYWRSGTVHGGKVVQYFSDRETIQRAALLTSQLWRGIPYWRTSTKSANKGNVSFNTQNAIYSPGVITSNQAGTTTFTTSFGGISDVAVTNSTNLIPCSSTDAFLQKKAYIQQYAHVFKQVAEGLTKQTADCVPDWPEDAGGPDVGEPVMVKEEVPHAGSDDDVSG